MKSFNDLVTRLKSLGHIPAEKIEALIRRIEQILSYEARVGVFGKCGVGKSSLCNALFGSDVAAVSDIGACTRKPQDIFVRIGGGGIKLLDCPGVGESAERDKEYDALYHALLPELDLIIWLLRADDRAYSVDEQFFHKIVKPHLADGKPFFFVVSQADKIEPVREWNVEQHLPGAKQQQNLDAKLKHVADYFQIPIETVVPVSAHEEFNLVHLVDQIVFALPRDRKIAVARAVKSENLSKEAEKEAERGFFEAVGEEVGKTVGLGAVGKAVGKAVDDYFLSWFKGWWG